MPPLPNQRQERFARAIVSGKPATRAYEEAGYQPHHANPTRLRENESVQARIRELSRPATRRAQVTADTLLEELEIARAGAERDGQRSAQVAATLGKVRIAGLDIKRTEIGTPGEFESMRAEELAAALVKMLREYGLSVIEDDAGPEMIGVTPGEATALGHDDRSRLGKSANK